MARPIRKKVLYDGCYAHIYTRSLSKVFICQDGEDFEVMKELLRQTKQNYNYQTYHYCLMNTHFHMAVRIGEVDRFSKALKEIKQSYLRWYRHRYKGSGTIWRGRYGSQVIENERYLGLCGQYIENNPVEAGLVVRAEDWPYSSCGYYLSGKKDDLVDGYNRPADVELDGGVANLNFEDGPVIGSELYELHFAEM